MREISASIPAKLEESYRNITENKYKFVVWYGGRGSAKSRALAFFAVRESYVDHGTILCAREFLKSVGKSIYSSIVSTIKRLGLSDDFEILKRSIVNKRTGATFLFEGLQANITDLKSIDDLRCVIVDEAENVSQNSWDIITPTPRGFPNLRFYIVFNTRFEADPTWQTFVANPKSRSHIVKINWRDNPWFHESGLEEERQDALRGDIGKYNWIWEGDFLRVSDRSILGRQLKVDYFDVDDTFGHPYIGIDWGFSNDPNVIVECYVKSNNLYIHKCGIKTQVQLTATAGWLQSKAPMVTRYPAYADSARPETISMVSKTLPMVKACKKWSGSIEDGVSFLQTFENIIIHPKACTNQDEQDELIAELYGYSYKVLHKDTPQEEVTADIEDASNNVADAIRYALQPLIKKNHGFVFA